VCFIRIDVSMLLTPGGSRASTLVRPVRLEGTGIVLYSAEDCHSGRPSIYRLAFHPNAEGLLHSSGYHLCTRQFCKYKGL
jgi:hypothetical protein